MKHFIIGASGQVGKAVSNLIEPIDRFSPPCDLRHKPTWRDLSFKDVDVVWLIGYKTNVDQCQTDPEYTNETNIGGIYNVVGTLNRTNPDALLVFYSSDYVFDGRGGPYSESCLPSPINHYGAQKLIAEQYIAANVKNYYIIRTNMVYGPDSDNNFVVRMARTLSSGKEEVSAVYDEWVTPTFGPDLAKQSLKLITDHAKHGIYHIAGPESLTRYQITRRVAETMGLDTSYIFMAKSVDMGHRANRPQNGGLISDKGYMSQVKLKEALAKMYTKLILKEQNNG